MVPAALVGTFVQTALRLPMSSRVVKERIVRIPSGDLRQIVGCAIQACSALVAAVTVLHVQGGITVPRAAHVRHPVLPEPIVTSSAYLTSRSAVYATLECFVVSLGFLHQAVDVRKDSTVNMHHFLQVQTTAFVLQAHIAWKEVHIRFSVRRVHTTHRGALTARWHAKPVSQENSARLRAKLRQVAHVQLGSFVQVELYHACLWLIPPISRLSLAISAPKGTIARKVQCHHAPVLQDISQTPLGRSRAITVPSSTSVLGRLQFCPKFAPSPTTVQRYPLLQNLAQAAPIAAQCIWARRPIACFARQANIAPPLQKLNPLETAKRAISARLVRVRHLGSWRR
jgi:hypothetical protein